MQGSSYHFLPPLFPLLLVLLGLLVAALQIGVLGYAYEKMGVSRIAAYAILLVSLLGASVNIPVAELGGQQEAVGVRVEVDPWFGTRTLVPVIREVPETTLAVNLGGAVIPTLLSIYLISKHQIYGPAAIGVSVVSVVVYMIAKPVEQMGIAVPMLIPPIISAAVAMMLSRDYAAPLAYVSGCLGTLIGADLLNLGLLTRLGASVASIGGAGTFDGVFLSGILAVLLAGGPWLPRHGDRGPSAEHPDPYSGAPSAEEPGQYGR